MPRLTIPLVGSYNQRSIDGSGTLTQFKDQRFVNCVFEIAINPASQSWTVYCSKRPGWGVSGVVEAGSVSTGVIQTDTFGSAISAFGSSNSTIYDSTISVGTVTGLAIHFFETLIGGSGTIMIRSSDGSAWYYVSGSKTTLSYAGDTHSNTTLDNLGSTAGMYPGQAISGANIPAGTRIQSVDSTVKVTMTQAATSTTAGVTITKTPIAKILDADFVTTGTNLSSFIDMGGFLFYCTEDGYLYNSDLNSVSSYTASNKIACDMSSDLPVAVARTASHAVCFNSKSTELFYNAGNAVASPLGRAEPLYFRTGALNQRSVTQLEDDIYYVTSSAYGGISIRKVGQKEPISTSFIDNILGTSYASGAEIYLSSFYLDGIPYLSAVVLAGTVPTNSLLKLENDDKLLLESSDRLALEGDPTASASFIRHFVCNLKFKIWSEWDSNLCTYITGVGAGATNQIIAASRVSTAGKVYRINPAADGELHQDDGSAYTMSVQFQTYMGTNKRKFINEFRINADNQTSGNIALSWSDDDGLTWSTPVNVSLTSSMKKVSYGLNSFRGKRLWKLEDSGSNANRVSEIEIEYDVSTT